MECGYDTFPINESGTQKCDLKIQYLIAEVEIRIESNAK